jgi:hypothetical protein
MTVRNSPRHRAAEVIRGEPSGDFQPTDLTTGERLKTTGRAVMRGVAHELRGRHETETGTVDDGHPDD